MYLDWAILHYSFRRQKMIDKIKENWEKILLILKEEHEVSDVSYRTWLQPLTPYSFKGNTVTIIVPEQTFLAYVKKKYGLLLKVTISEFLDQDCDVDFKVKDQIEEEKQAQAPSLIQKNKAVVSPDVIQSANLNPKYTFDTFVVGSNNNLAHAAALAVAESFVGFLWKDTWRRRDGRRFDTIGQKNLRIWGLNHENNRYHRRP